MKKLNIKEEDAWRKLYSGGLRIHGTLDIKMQRAAEKEFQKNSNFPKVVSVSKDPNGNVKDKRGKILLYKYSNMFADNGNFTVQPQEFTKNDNGSVTLLQGKRLNFYKTEVGGNIDYSVELKPMYVIENGLFYNIGGAFLTIPAKYKSRDNDGNLILNAEFFKDYPKHQPGEYGIVFPPDSYQLKAKVIQPQTSLVVLDYHTGAIKVMVGGRNIEGKRLYNRANNPRQPGSSIKPMAVYAPALQRSADMVTNNNVGKYTMWTAVSGIKDEALKNVLTEIFGEKTIGESNNLLCIPSYSFTDARPWIFKYDHKEGNLDRDNKARYVDVALTTSAAPTYLPLAEIDLYDYKQFIWRHTIR